MRTAARRIAEALLSQSGVTLASPRPDAIVGGSARRGRVSVRADRQSAQPPTALVPKQPRNLAGDPCVSGSAWLRFRFCTGRWFAYNRATKKRIWSTKYEEAEAFCRHPENRR